MIEYAVFQNGSIVKRLPSGLPFTLGKENFPENWLTLSETADKIKRNIYPIVYINGKDLPDTKDYVENSPVLINDEVQIAWVTSDKSQGEKDSIVAAKKQLQINDLKNQLTLDRFRLAFFGKDNDWLLHLQEQIEALEK